MPETAALPVFDRAMLDTLIADIGRTRVINMLSLYQREALAFSHAIAAAFADYDYPAIARRCHAIRTTTETLGFGRFAGELLRTELAASHRNDESLRPNSDALTRLQADYAATALQVAALCDEFGANIK